MNKNTSFKSNTISSMRIQSFDDVNIMFDNIRNFVMNLHEDMQKLDIKVNSIINKYITDQNREPELLQKLTTNDKLT